MKTFLKLKTLLIPGPLLALTFVALFTTGCDQLANVMTKNINVSADFENAKGLEEKAVVSLNGLNIGHVSSISPTANGVSVQLALKQDKASAVLENAAAIIVEQQPRLVQIVNGQPGSGSQEKAIAIAEGGKLRGLNNQLELAAWQGGALLGGLQGMFDDAVGSVKEYFESDDWQQTRNKFETQLNDLGKQSSDAMNEINLNLDEIVKNLQTQSAEAMQQAQTEYGKLQENLTKFQQEGQVDMADSLQKILDNLNAAMQKQPESQ